MERRRETEKRFKEWELPKKLLFAAGMVLLAFYVGGFLATLFLQSEVQLNPLHCIISGLTTGTGLKWSLVSAVLFTVVGALIVLQGRGNGEMDERNFEISPEGTYGTAGFMKKQEQEQILKADKDTETVNGIIFGKELDTGNIISLPVESRLNRNIAVCGSQGSMKSRAFARVMALQCVRRGESMYITDPKSELYEDLCAYLKSEGYTVKQLNLIQLTRSDAWNCLAEIDEGELIDVFCDVVIRNTTDKFDHFYDNVEMDLLKALCLYVYEEYPEQQKTFPEAYKLLLNKSVEALDSIFERLPGNHPAKGPYQLFSKAEKVKGNAVLGLGTRLQILQNKLVQQITSHTDIDLTLPGREKCAYFCITSDQDSTYDMLATLFTSFLSIKLVRFADKTEERKLPISMNFILDEFPNIGVIPDFKKKLATARSRAIGMSILYQNIPQLQNRYPDNQWEEILGGCDFSIFLGCNDMTTASYFSDRIGEITVAVSSIRKNYYTIRATDYVPEYSESSSVGKRQLLLPDEVLRFRKMDYTEHADAKKLKMEKVEAHIPDWYSKWEQEKAQFRMLKLKERHKADLRRRGLSEAEISAMEVLGYCSTDRESSRRIARRLLAGGFSLKGVPGFFMNRSGDWEAAFYKGNEGYLCPVRNVDKEIAGFQIRLDAPYQKRKYVWFTSSGMEGGTSSKSPCSLSGKMTDGSIRVTEGILKAEIACQKSGLAYIGNPGVSNHKGLYQMLKNLKAQGLKTVYECYDMDKMLLLDCVMDYDKSCPQCEFSSGSECPKKRQKRDNIRKGCLKLYEICGELGLKCLRMEWDTDSNGMWNGDYKGIDDWLTKNLKSGLRAA